MYYVCIIDDGRTLMNGNAYIIVYNNEISLITNNSFSLLDKHIFDLFWY